MPITTTHIIALATAFKDSLEGRGGDWTQTERFGALRILVSDDQGLHPAFLARVYAGLERAILAFADEPGAWFKGGRTATDIAHTVARSFGVGIRYDTAYTGADAIDPGGRSQTNPRVARARSRLPAGDPRGRGSRCRT